MSDPPPPPPLFICDSFIYHLQAFCFVAMVLFLFLVVWSAALLKNLKGNDKVVKYTLKEAITG